MRSPARVALSMQGGVATVHGVSGIVNQVLGRRTAEPGDGSRARHERRLVGGEPSAEQSPTGCGSIAWRIAVGQTGTPVVHQVQRDVISAFVRLWLLSTGEVTGLKLAVLEGPLRNMCGGASKVRDRIRVSGRALSPFTRGARRNQ